MTQRFWQIYTPDQWVAFDETEWNTFLLEPGLTSATVAAASSPSAVQAAGVIKRSGVVSAASQSAAVAASGIVTPLRKTGSVLAVSFPSSAYASGTVSHNADVVAISARATTQILGKRGINGVVSAVSGESRAGTPLGLSTGTTTCASSACVTVISGQVRSRVTGVVQAVSAPSSAIITSGTTRIYSPSMIESLRCVDASFIAVRNPVDALWLSPPSYTKVVHKAELSKFAVRRENAEVELFHDDREVDLSVGGYDK